MVSADVWAAGVIYMAIKGYLWGAAMKEVRHFKKYLEDRM
jgi:hypothetical protein